MLSRLRLIVAVVARCGRTAATPRVYTVRRNIARARGRQGGAAGTDTQTPGGRTAYTAHTSGNTSSTSEKNKKSRTCGISEIWRNSVSSSV